MSKKLTAAVAAFAMIFSMLPQVFAADLAQADADALTLSVIAKYDGGTNRITRSLYLPDKGSVNNSEITWQSDNTANITCSGRVIRPRTDEDDAVATLIATVKNGGNTVTKSFDFTVLKDEKFTDPKFMSDEDFFGRFSNGEWVTESKLDYGQDGLAAVKEYAQSGDYENAKNALLEYFRQRPTPFYRDKNLGKVRNAQWADFVLDDFYHMGHSEYFKGDFYMNTDEKDYSAELPASEIKRGMVSFGIRARYNEASSAEFYSKDCGNPALAPRMRVTADGEVREYTAVKDTYVRHGDYSNTPYGSEEKVIVKTFGDFLGNDTYQSVVTFDFSDISPEASITKAELVLHGAVYPESAGEKRLVIVKEGNTTYDEASASRYTFPGMIYSFNGLPEKNTWQKVTGQEGEYFWQAARFLAWQTIALEYDCTKNEDYVYKAMAIAEDYLKDNGGRKFVGTAYQESADGLRGGFPRTLDAAIKNTSFECTLDYFKNSRYFTADLLTAMLKNIWDTAHYLTVYHSPNDNWRQHEFVSLLNTTLYIPEFKDAKSGEQWQKLASDTLGDILFLNTMEDGSYVESTTAYSVAALSDFSGFKSDMINMGADVSAEYDERLLKNAYYNGMLYFPDGSGLGYGDSSRIGVNYGTYKSVCDWYNAEDLRYITTLGAQGTKPGYTSYHWKDSRVTVMRNDWTVNSPYLFTNVRGGGSHGHADDNQIVLYAYGRELLPDRGIFSYATTGDLAELTKWGKSSLAHSTVAINDTSQEYKSGTKGSVQKIVLEDNYNYLKQTTPNTEGYDHERAILYLKPDLWIVSDRMTPDDADKVNDYKQKWFTNYDANISSEEKTLRSNYSEGANIIITSADADEDVHIDDCVFDRSTNELVETKYGYFEKKSAGECRFDTLLTAVENDNSASVTSEKLSEDAYSAAMRFDITRSGEKLTVYYCRSNGTGAVFGDFETDAEAAAVVCTENGDIENIVRIGGNYIKKKSSGEVIDGKAPGGKLVAGINGSVCAVYGTLDASEAGSIVTGCLAKKSAAGNVTAEDIIWADAVTVDDYGRYMFRFKIGGNIDDYSLKLNIAGKPYIQNFTRISDDGAVIRALFNASKCEDFLEGVMQLDNLYLNDSVSYTYLLAFYDADGKLIKVSTDENNLSDREKTIKVSEEYPADTAQVKAMIWKNMKPNADILTVK